MISRGIDTLNRAIRNNLYLNTTSLGINYQRSCIIIKNTAKSSGHGSLIWLTIAIYITCHENERLKSIV